MTDVFIGFDTSNYTTSAAVCDGEGNVIENLKIPLSVKDGEVGLRQSDAVFAHVKNLPHITDQLRDVLRQGMFRVAAVACSSKPRSAEGSYMPCFLVGRAAASAVAAALGVPLIETSHQVGHIVAATLSACIDKSSFSQLFNGEYIALHVSGGTTDILYVEPSPDELVKISRIGGSMDANAGQIIDRIGVSLGFSFPCGSQLDRAALRVSKPPHIGNLPVRGSEFNLSGLQNIAEKMISDGCSVTDVSAYVLEYIAQSLCRAVIGTQKLRGNLPVIFAGGVMSSEYIKHRLAGIGSFSAPELSSDNAVGVAVTGAVLYRRGVRCSGGGE